MWLPSMHNTVQLGMVVVLGMVWCVQAVFGTGPSGGLQWLEGQAAQLVQDCVLTAHDGTVLFTPDASSSYGAQWTRDFAYMLGSDGGSSFFHSNISELTVREAVLYTFKGQRSDGCMPDRVQADGLAVYSPGGTGHGFADHAIDNMPFSGLLLLAYMNFSATLLQRTRRPAALWLEVQLRTQTALLHPSIDDDDASSSVTTRVSMEAASTFCKLEPQVRRAMDFLNYMDGLVYNDPAHPNCTYGFTDTVAKQGQLLFSSLLTAQASRGMAQWSKALNCGNWSQWQTEATRISAAVASLFDENVGMFRACSTGPNALPDVWGSCLAIQQGCTTPSQAASIIHQLTAEPATFFQQGQVRHLPAPLVWGKCFGGACPAPGTYQNGAFWATPLSWIVPVLHGYGTPGAKELAAQLANDTLSSFQKGGIMECVNQDLHYHGVERYVDSGTNALAGLRAVLSRRLLSPLSPLPWD